MQDVKQTKCYSVVWEIVGHNVKYAHGTCHYYFGLNKQNQD